MKSKLMSTVMAIFVLLSVSACGGYYKVKDPTTDNVYYTKDLKQKNGTVMLKDANTGSMVTIQNSEVTEINKEEVKANTKKE